jgi:hypothetical protein
LMILLDMVEEMKMFVTVMELFLESALFNF